MLRRGCSRKSEQKVGRDSNIAKISSVANSQHQSSYHKDFEGLGLVRFSPQHLNIDQAMHRAWIRPLKMFKPWPKRYERPTIASNTQPPCFWHCDLLPKHDSGFTRAVARPSLSWPQREISRAIFPQHFLLFSNCRKFQEFWQIQCSSHTIYYIIVKSLMMTFDPWRYFEARPYIDGTPASQNIPLQSS